MIEHPVFRFLLVVVVMVIMVVGAQNPVDPTIPWHIDAQLSDQ